MNDNTKNEANETINCHVIPRFILKRYLYKDNLSLYDLSSDEFIENKSVTKAFVVPKAYSTELEKKLANNAESAFARLVDKLLGEEDITITKGERVIINRYLLSCTLRSPFIKQYLENIVENIKRVNKNKIFKLYFGVKDKYINTLSTKDYVEQTLKVYLDYDGTLESITQNKKVTFLATGLIYTIHYGMIALWDAPDNKEFIIGDCIYTPEVERSLYLDDSSIKERYFVDLSSDSGDYSLSHLLEDKEDAFKQSYINFMGFPLSKNRTLVLIHPFFRYIFPFFSTEKKKNVMQSVTNLDSVDLFEPCKKKYFFEDDGDYVLSPTKMSCMDYYYFNNITLHEAIKYIAFGDKEKVIGSLVSYELVNVNNRDKRDYNTLINLLDPTIAKKIL